MVKTTVDKAWFQTRLRALGRTQAELARYLGIPAPAVTNILDGKRNVKVQEARGIATFLACSVADIHIALGVRGSPPAGEKQPIMGYVGAGDQVILYQESDPGYGLDFIKSPFPGYKGAAVRIRGDSMSPRYRENEVIGYTEASGDIGQLLGAEVVAKLEDGRLVLKVLQGGSEPGLYTLISLNATTPPILNVALDWVSEIDWHKPSPPPRNHKF